MDDIITSKNPLSTKFTFLVNGLKKDFYRRSCYLCNEIISAEYFICPACTSDFPWQRSPCLKCGLDNHRHSLVTSLTNRQFESIRKFSPDCNQCAHQSYYFDRCFTAFKSAYPIMDIIHQFKYDKKFNWYRPLAKLLADYFITHESKLYIERLYPFPELIIPVPMAKDKLREREYNHAFEIAALFSKKTRIPISNRLVDKKNNIANQATLSIQQRVTNSADSFYIRSKKEDISGKSVMIFDDVITTGSTVNALAKLLKDNGAKSVEVFGVARTQKFKETP